MDVLEQVTEIFQEVFDDPNLALTRNTTAADVEGWDSLMHVRLVIAIEKAFSVRFATSEVASFKEVGDLVDAVGRKIDQRSGV